MKHQIVFNLPQDYRPGMIVACVCPDNDVAEIARSHKADGYKLIVHPDDESLEDKVFTVIGHLECSFFDLPENLISLAGFSDWRQLSAELEEIEPAFLVSDRVTVLVLQ